MASPDAHLDNKPQLSYDTSVERRSLHAYEKIKAKTRLFRKAGPAFRGFHFEDCYRLTHLKFVSLLQSHENEEKQLEKDLFTLEGLTCGRCTLSFSSRDHLKIHSYFCGNPNIVAGDLKALKKHHDLLENQDGGMLFCPWCPILCLNTVALHKHVRSCRDAHRERDERQILERLPCPECPSEFSHLQKLSNHMQSHYVADFSCSACKISFRNEKSLAYHLTNCENRRRPYRCADCNRTFKHSKALRMHVLSCRKSVQCLKCAKFFPGKSLCVEHVVMHILAEWTKDGLQMIDGVLYKIRHHKIPQENYSKPTLSSVSPCSSPEPVESQEEPVKPANSTADLRPISSLERRSGLSTNKAPSSIEKLVDLLHKVKDSKTADNNLPEMSSNTKSSSIVTQEQSLERNLGESDNAKKLNYTLRPVSNSSDPPVTIPDSDPGDMLSGDEDNLSVIENEVYEIEHTLDEDEFLIEPEMCDNEPTFENGRSLRNSVEATFELQPDVAELFTPATDIESEDSNKLTLTVVNVEGGANLFDWDDCNSEEGNCDAAEMGESQVETYGPPAEINNDVHLVVDGQSDRNEDGDSGIGATDDDSNKDRSEVLDKCDDVISNHSEMEPKLSDVPGKAGEAPCPLASAEVFVSSSSCDTEIVVESSPTIQIENMESSLVIPKSYSVLAEHSYARPVNSGLTSNASKGTVRAKEAPGPSEKQENTSEMSVSEHQEDHKKSQKHKKMKVSASGMLPKTTSKKCSLQSVGEKTKSAGASITEQDPLQKILEVMSKEARQTLTKKSKPIKYPSVCKKPPSIPINHSHPIESITVAAEEQSNADINVFSELGDDILQKNMVPICENNTASDHSVSLPQLMDNAATQSSKISNENINATSSSGNYSMVQEEAVAQPEIVTDRPPSERTPLTRTSRADFMEIVKPPMSLNKMLRRERSMLKHGFKQIATVLPQRKESHMLKKASICNNPVAVETANPHVKPFIPAQIPALGVVKHTSSDDLLRAISTAETVKPVSNIIYIELPSGPSAIPPLAPMALQTNVVLARLVPTAPITSTANSCIPNQSPAHFTFRIQQQPTEVISTLEKPDSDVTSQATSVNSEVQLAPNSAIAVQTVINSPGISFKSTKGMVSSIKENAVSGIAGRPVFAKISPTNCSSGAANLVDVPSTSLTDSYLNLQLSEETMGCKENLPPIQEASQTNEHENELKMENTILEKSKQLESINLKQDVIGNSDSINYERNVPLIKLSSAAANLVDVMSTSNLHSQSSEETSCSKESLPLVEETPCLPANEYENELNKQNTVFPENEHENDLRKENTVTQTQQLEINHSKPNEIGVDRTNFEDSVPLMKSNCLTYSSSDQLDTGNVSETTAVKAAEESLLNTIKCNLVDKEEKQLKGKNDSEKDLPGSPPGSSFEDGFEDDVSECNDSTLDHEIKALISCLDSNIACEETRNPKDQAVDSEQYPSIEIPLKENLQTHVSESSLVETIKINNVSIKTDPKLNVVKSKPFEVCSMQLCNSGNQNDFSLNSLTIVGNPTEETRLARTENASVPMKKKHLTTSHFRTNMYASRKLMTEMKYFKQHRYGREGLHQSTSVCTYNCNHCSQWFYSQISLEGHTCLKAIIRGKFTSEQFDRLIDKIEKIEFPQISDKVGENQPTPLQVECAQDSVQVGQSQPTPNSAQTYVSPYLSYLQMKATVKHKKFICEKCKIRCKSFSALLEHKSSAHDEKYSVECHICGKNFSRLQQLAVHVAKSHKVKTNPSMETPIKSVKDHAVKSSLFRKTAALLTKRHKIPSNKGPSIKKALPMVEKTPSKNVVGSEEATVHVAESPRSPSKESGDPKTALNSLLREVTSEYEKDADNDCLRKETPAITEISNPESSDNNGKCSICNKHFKGKAGLISHMVQAHREDPIPSIEDDVTQCSICNKLFKGKGGLTSHMNQAHRTTFKCPLCLRRFCYIQTLKFHLAKEHSSSLNTDGFSLDAVKPADSVEFSPPKLMSPEVKNISAEKNVESLLLPSSDGNSLGTPGAKDEVCNASSKETNQKIQKKTKWKFVRDTSSEETPSLEQPAENSSGSHDADNQACKMQSDNVSPIKSDIKKPKKIKWRIVKDVSPEKVPSPERPAKSPRLTDSNHEPAPSLVISFSKVKKHRYKCSLCKKYFKKYQHLVQHQVGAHKFSPELQLQSHLEQRNKKSEESYTVSSAGDQDCHSQVTTSNCPANVAILENNLCTADKENRFDCGNRENAESSSEDIVSATIETETCIVDSTTSDNCERSNEEQTNFPNPPDALSKGPTSNSASSIPSETSKTDQVSPSAENDSRTEFECNICLMQFSAKGYLERHNIKSHGAPCKFSCTLCDKIFVDIRSLRYHKKLKHNHKNIEEQNKCKTTKERQCVQCDKRFRRDIDLRKHKRRVHKIFRRYKCCLCKLNFKSELLLAAHDYETHSESSEGKAPSPNKPYDVIQEIINGVTLQSGNPEGMTNSKGKPEDVQEDLDILKCMDCSLTYKTVSCLKRHRISMHADQATHRCDVCGKGFSYPHSLKNHMMIHSRKLRRSVRSNYPQEDLEEPGPNCEESEATQDGSIPAVLEKESDLLIIPLPDSGTIAKKDISDKLEEDLTKPLGDDKKPDQEDNSFARSQDGDLQHCPMDTSLPAPEEDISHQENNCVPGTFDSGSTLDCSVPTETYSLNNSCSKTDVPSASSDAGSLNANMTDCQLRPAPQVHEYQLPSTLYLSAPSITPVPEPPSTPSFDQFQGFNACTLCGLCLPSWYALQEHYYMFHSHPNYYAAPPAPSPYAAAAPPAPSPYPAPALPAPSPYAASLEYSAFPNQNVSYSGWTQQHQLANISSSVVFNSGAASFQELTSHSGAHCSVCGLGFPSLYALQEHYATHMAASKPTVQYCGGFY